jgi:hypothetical protein
MRGTLEVTIHVVNCGGSETRGGGKGVELRKMKDDTVEYHPFAELSKVGKALRFPVTS